jgi:lipopolysaccharide/colanic/teichoic acid biosynthesis glycosyltransferase
MSLAARVWPADAEGPFGLSEQIRRIREETPWEAMLPPQTGMRRWQLQQVLKRILDVVLAGAALVALAPLFLAIATIIRLTSPGPIFYEWRVLGRRARPFIGYKFRTMVVDADVLKARFLDRNEMNGPVFKIRDDPRVTPLGRWLRRYSLDELPQLWSVVKGDMSLVGPRPPAPEEFIRFEPWQRAKLAVTPGITCLWQVNGRNEISDFDSWARLDLEYIRTWTLWLDLKILLRTIPAVLSGRGAY